MSEKRKFSELELKGMQALIKEWSGLDFLLVDAGPSVSDPMGQVTGYISFRDSKTAVAIAFDDEGLLRVMSGKASNTIWERP